MGKEGPCFHCGIEHTPLWRHGPPDKPVLCNACGSRWRIRKTLDNYVPKHAIASKVTGRRKARSNQQGKLPLEVQPIMSMGFHTCRKPSFGAKLGERTYNGSSSDSEVSSFENEIQMGSISGKNISDSAQLNFWDIKLPTRKRSVLKQRILSPIERLQRQLYDILQEPEFSMLSRNQDVLIYNTKQMSNAQTDLGATLFESSAASSTEEDPGTHSLVLGNEASCSNDPPIESTSL